MESCPAVSSLSLPLPSVSLDSFQDQGGGEEDILPRLQQELDSDPSNPERHMEIGLLLWRRADKTSEEQSRKYQDRAADHFLSSAKLNPNDGSPFRYLGHYYATVSLDTNRASKCYQRALTLNPDDSESGEGLCNLLDAEGKEILEIAVCKDASHKSPRAFWAFKRLGYLQVHQKKWLEAVQSLQHAIRGFPACAQLWEALGLAYQKMGMLTAALKAYGRAIELDSGVFASIESGNILLMLGSFRKGVEQFRHALMASPCIQSAYYGLASCLLGLAKECVASGAFGWGASLLKEASEATRSGVGLNGNVSSLWKLHGDIQIAYAQCFPWEGESNSTDADAEVLAASIVRWKKDCISAANNAKLSYQRALHLGPWQANIYGDIAICLDVQFILEGKSTSDTDVWLLSEKMSLGSLMLEGANNDFWVVLGCLSKDNALKQHAFIRALQLDASLSAPWSYLGKLYWDVEDQHLARRAFDRARSIDPSLALPWASISINCNDGKGSSNEAFESCLRAVQMIPLAEFQIGLGTLAINSENLLAPQVLGAIKQAVQRAPYYPESHNLSGLVCEMRSDHLSAIISYRRSRIVLGLHQDPTDDSKSRYALVTANLARSLCKAGYALDASIECENLMKEGLLDNKGLHIYAFSLWKTGRNDHATLAMGNLMQRVSTMNHTCAAVSLGLICKLSFFILGQDSTISNILQLPQELIYTTNLKFLVYVLNALYPKKELQSLLPNIYLHSTSYDVAIEMRSLIAIGKMIGDPSKEHLDITAGVNYLRKALHIYPDSILIRSQLSSLLLSTEDWMGCHNATRCISLRDISPSKKGFRPPYQIHGAAVVACYAACGTDYNFSSSTCCGKQHLHGTDIIHHIQRCLHQKPWNTMARYFLVLTLLQKAREHRFPPHLRVTLKRLLIPVLSKKLFLGENKFGTYQNFVLSLCASEVCLLSGDYVDSVCHISNILKDPTHCADQFCAHLQLCRAFAAKGDLSNFRNHYNKCLQLNTSNSLDCIMLKYLESKCKLPSNMDIILKKFKACLAGKGSASNQWEALFYLVCGQCFLFDQDLFSAEEALRLACSKGNSDDCLLLCHGSICMELARQRSGSQFLSDAVRSLAKAQASSCVPLPLVSVLLAQAKASLGVTSEWGRNLSEEWFSWPAEMRPAEMFFQLYLRAKQSNLELKQRCMVELPQNSETWILRAIHLNPSCLRYWKVLGSQNRDS